MISQSEAAPYRNVWVAAVAQAVRDIFRTAKSRDGCNDQEHHRAVAWIGTRDFHKTCALAGLDGVAVEQKLRHRLAQIAAGDQLDEILRHRPGVRRAGGRHGRPARGGKAA